MERGKLLLQFVNQHRSKSEIDDYRKKRSEYLSSLQLRLQDLKTDTFGGRKDINDFFKKYLSLVLEKNNANEWELDAYDDKQPPIAMLKDIDTYIPFTDIDVFEFGKKGLELVFKKLPEGPIFSFHKHQPPIDIFSIKALPACEARFHRDWERGGICVKREEKYAWASPD